MSHTKECDADIDFNTTKVLFKLKNAMPRGRRGRRQFQYYKSTLQTNGKSRLSESCALISILQKYSSNSLHAFDYVHAQKEFQYYKSTLQTAANDVTISTNFEISILQKYSSNLRTSTAMKMLNNNFNTTKVLFKR